MKIFNVRVNLRNRFYCRGLDQLCYVGCLLLLITRPMILGLSQKTLTCLNYLFLVLNFHNLNQLTVLSAALTAEILPVSHRPFLLLLVINYRKLPSYNCCLRLPYCNPRARALVLENGANGSPGNCYRSRQ